MPYSGLGAGTEVDRHQITSVAQYNEIIADYEGSHAILMNDLDVAGGNLREGQMKLEGDGYSILNIGGATNSFDQQRDYLFNSGGYFRNGELNFNINRSYSNYFSPFQSISDLCEKINFTGSIVNTGAGYVAVYARNVSGTGTLQNCKNSIDASGAICQLFDQTISGATTDKIIYTGQMTDNTGDSSGIKRLASQVFGPVTNTFYDTQKNPDLVALSGGSSGAEASLADAGKTTAELQTLATYTNTATAGLTTAYNMVAKSNFNETQTWFLPSADYPKLSFEYDAITLNPITLSGVAQEGVLVDIEVYDDYTKSSGYELITTVATDVNGVATFFSGDIPAGKKVFIVPHLNDTGVVSSDQAKFVSDTF